MILAPVATPPVQTARGRGDVGRGHPKGEGYTSRVHARCYAFRCRPEVVAYDVVIIGIVSVCRREASMLFDPGSTYSYVSSYFASNLCMYCDPPYILVWFVGFIYLCLLAHS